MRALLIMEQHKWFQEAKKGKDNEFRDFYIWRKPKCDADGRRQPPNNWGAVWGGTLRRNCYHNLQLIIDRKRMGV
jgi:glycosidase